MAKKKGAESTSKHRPAPTPEARENQLIALAVDLAEQQLRDGTASNQVIVHYLKLGSSKDRLERKLLEEKTKLAEAKTESIQASHRIEELYSNALEAMRIYSGSIVSEDEEDDIY